MQRVKRTVVFWMLALIAFSPGCTHLFFRPSREFVINPEIIKRSPADVYFTSSDGLTLHGWYFRAKEERGTILI